MSLGISFFGMFTSAADSTSVGRWAWRKAFSMNSMRALCCVQFLDKRFSPVGVRDADGFRVQQANEFAAALHEGEGVQKVFVAAVEGRFMMQRSYCLKLRKVEKIIVAHVGPPCRAGGRQGRCRARCSRCRCRSR